MQVYYDKDANIDIIKDKKVTLTLTILRIPEGM